MAKAKFAENINFEQQHIFCWLHFTFVKKGRDKEKEQDEGGRIEHEEDECEEGVGIGEHSTSTRLELDADQDHDDEDWGGAGDDHVDEPAQPVHRGRQSH